MLYYTVTLTCPHCRCACPGAVVAEVEPPPDAVFTVRCPSHGGPYRIAFRHFKPVEQLPPGSYPHHYPPRPPSPPTAAQSPSERRRWWQFWKR